MRTGPTRFKLQGVRNLFFRTAVAGPNGKTQTMNINIEAGKQMRQTFNLGDVNYEELEKELAKP